MLQSGKVVWSNARPLLEKGGCSMDIDMDDLAVRYAFANTTASSQWAPSPDTKHTWLSKKRPTVSRLLWSNQWKDLDSLWVSFAVWWFHFISRTDLIESIWNQCMPFIVTSPHIHIVSNIAFCPWLALFSSVSISRLHDYTCVATFGCEGGGRPSLWASIQWNVNLTWKQGQGKGIGDTDFGIKIRG